MSEDKSEITLPAVITCLGAVLIVVLGCIVGVLLIVLGFNWRSS